MRASPAFLSLALASAVSAASGAARADKVVLVGGEIIEGQATRQGGKVKVQIESGEIALPAAAVLRIEKAESFVGRYEARYAALPPRDVASRLSLADYCRDHDMRSKERGLLAEVLDIDPNNAAARSRLGYVKTDAGWVKESDAQRSKGLVSHEGQWVTRAELADIERARAEVESRAQQREAEAELQDQRRRLAVEQAELEAERTRVRTQLSPPATFFTPVYGSAFPSFAPTTAGCQGFAEQCRPRPRLVQMPPAFDTTSWSVVKVPYRSFTY